MNNKVNLNTSHIILIIALLACAFASYLLLAPYINSIVMAFIISLLMFPIHQWIEGKLPKLPNIAAFLSCVVLTFIIVIPLSLVLGAILQQGSLFSQNLYKWVTNGGIQTLFELPWITKSFAIANEYLPFDSIEPQDIAEKIGQFATSFGSSLVGVSARVAGDVTNVVLDFFLMLFVLFFLLRDHDKIITALRHILPFSRSQEDKLLSEIESVSKSAVMGSFLTAIAQGIAGGLGMWAAGFPGLFWGTMMGFASFVPVVGTALIWIPAVIYLLLIDSTSWAIFLAVWSILIVGSIDNLLRPFLMQGSGGMSTMMLFFSLLGGIHLFGLIGLIYGPLIFAITLVLFKIYEEEFKDFLDQQDNS